MVTPEQIQQAISLVNDQTSFIQGLLYDTLQWPVDGGIEKVEDISFAWTAQELRAEGLDQKVVEGQIWQIQPLQEKQPWGVFLLEFNNVDAFIKGRGLTGPLRKVLRGLVSHRRKANLPIWERENLLFICTHRYQYFRFGYFKAPKETKIAPLTTFGWGPDTPARTACEFNLPALEWPQDPDNLNAWQEQWLRAFDKEKLTKDFFKIFATLYHEVVKDIAKVRELKDEAGKLAQLLLDRMLFLYFIQRKGWLDQKSDYLYSRFLECWEKDPDGYSYYPSVLYPLFFCLSNPNTRNDEIGAVPFLNGGLFEETSKQSQTEQINHARLRIKNSTFKLIFDNLLERFNFTVTEDTPLDVEVAIDPEMLGKIFESLILQLEKEPGKDLRKLTGSYYTPRPIVHFMCQEALKEYLLTQLAGDDNAKVQEYKEKVRDLLGLPQVDQVNHEQVETLKGLFTPAEAKILRQAVLDCRICDPAVGSGAFPVGMLHEMVAAIARLDLCLHGRDFLTQHNYYYDLKKQIIESSLYGVDIQEKAVRLCELRLWLSLIVDYQIDPDKPFDQAIKEVPSLPNLSYRIMRGDSLLERLFGHIVQLDTIAKDARTKQLIESIQADKQAYFREGSNTEKRNLELKILAKQVHLAERLIEAKQLSSGVQSDFWGEEGITAKARKEKAKQEARAAELEELKEKVSRAKTQLERQIRQKEMIDRGNLDTLRRKYFHTGNSPTFMWRVDYAEIFSGKGGFDIVIENPPYGAILDDVAPLIHLLYPESTQKHKDSYKNFIDLSLRILRHRGVYSLITPNTFLRQPRYEDIRKILSKTQPTVFFNLGENIFEESIVPVAISIGIKKDSSEFTALCSDISKTKDAKWRKKNIAEIPFNLVPKDELFRDYRSGINILPSCNENLLLREVKDYFDIKDAGINYQRTKVGMKVKGDSDLSARLLYEDKRKSKSDQMYWKGADIYRFYMKPRTHRWCRSNFKDFILPGEVVRLNQRVFSINPKILVRQTADRIIACLDEKGVWFGRSIIAVIPKKSLTKDEILFLLAALNSDFVTKAYRMDSGEKGRVFAQVKKAKIERLLLPDPKQIPSQLITEVAQLVRNLMRLLTKVEGDYDHKEVTRIEKVLGQKITKAFSYDAAAGR